MLSKSQGTKTLVAENLMLRKQLIKLSRKHKRSPKLSFLDRLSFAILDHFIHPLRWTKSATIIKFHKTFIKKKYHLLFSSKATRRPGPKRPTRALIELIVDQYGKK